MVRVRILDHTVFDIDHESAMLSGVLRTAVIIDPTQLDGPININVHSSETMKLIVTYMDHYKSREPFSRISRPLSNSDLRLSGVNEFDVLLIQSIHLDLVKSVLVASDYLDIPSLTELCCAKLAAYIKTVPLKQMMNKLGLTDITPAWAEAIRKKHPWCKVIQNP